MAAMTNEQFLDAKLALDIELELGHITAEVYRDTLVGYMDQWAQGGASVALAAFKGSTAITGLNLFLQEAMDWYAGPADGGPDNDGLYPLTDAVGNTYLVPSPAKIAASGPAEVDAAVAAALEQLDDLVEECETIRDDTTEIYNDVAALAAALNTNTYYTTEALGRAAVANGEYFKVINGTDGINIHKRIDAGTVTTPTVQMPSITKVGAMVMAHPCTAGGSAAAIVLTAAAGHTVNPGDLLVFSAASLLSSDQTVTVRNTSLFSNVAKSMTLPGTGDTMIPARMWGTGGTVIVRAITISSVDQYELVAPSLVQQQGVIRFNQTNSSGNTYEGSPIVGTKFPADGMGVLIEVQFSADKAGGGATFKYAAWSSTAFQIYDYDGTSTPPAKRWRAGELVTLQRMVAGNFKVLRVGARPASDAEALAGTDDTVMATPKSIATYWGGQKSLVTRPMWALDWTLPSASKPVKAIRIEQNRIIVDVLPQASAYRDGYTAHYDDVVRYEVMNLSGNFNAPLTVPHLWTITSMWARFVGIWYPLMNFSFNNTYAATTDTGQVHSVFDPVIYAGKASQLPADIMAFNGQGPAHGLMDCTACVIPLTGGNKLGNAIVDGTSIRDSWGIMEVVQGTVLSFQQTWKYKSGGASPIDLFTVGQLYNFAPLTGHQLTMMYNGQWTNSEAVGLCQGYTIMLPTRLPNRFSCRDESDVVTTHTVGTGVVGSVNIGRPKRVFGYHTERPGVGCQLELAPTYIPFRRNGSAAAWPADVFVTNDSSGAKARWPYTVGGTDFETETNNSFSCLAYLDGVHANAA